MNANGATEWKIYSRRVELVLQSNSCFAVVDGLFSPETPEYVSAHWLFAIENQVIVRGIFASIVSVFV